MRFREDLGYYLKKQQKDTYDLAKYVDFIDLKEGYYKVKSFSFITVTKERRVRVDFKNNLFVIIPRDDRQFGLRFTSNKDLRDLNKRNLMMHYSFASDKNPVHFFDYIKKPSLCHTCSKLQIVSAFADGDYRVLLFSIVKIKGKDRVCVHVNDNRHFIVPKNHKQVNPDNIEYWKKQRTLVNFFDRTVRFSCEDGACDCLIYKPSWWW